MIDAVEDVVEAEPHEAQRGLVPARIERDEPGIADELERALGLTRRLEPQHGHDAEAEAREPRIDREPRLIRRDRVVERDVEQRLVPRQRGVGRQRRAAQCARAPSSKSSKIGRTAARRAAAVTFGGSSAPAVLEDRERRHDPEPRRLAEHRRRAAPDPQVEQHDAVARRKVEVAHRRERHAHEDAQPLALRPRRTTCTQHVGRDVVRGRPRAGREQDATTRPSARRCGAERRLRGRCILTAIRGDSMQRCDRRDDGSPAVMALAWSAFSDVTVAGQAAGERAAASAAGRGWRRTFQVDPLWPKPLPNHWILGSVTGVAVDAQDHIWIVHRGAASLTARTENGTRDRPADGRSRAAGRRRRCSSSITAGTLVSSWGGPGEGYDWPQIAGRHRRRCQGQRLDHGGRLARSRRRPRRRRGGGGGAAAGRGGRGGTRAASAAAQSRRAHSEVLARRQVPAADRQARHDRRQREQDVVQPSRQHRDRRGRERALRRRRPRQPPRRRARRDDRRLQAALGRVRRGAGRRESRRRTIRRRRRRSSSAR